MMKVLLILTLLVSFSGNASAKKCAVYGITDSPQRLDCYFPKVSEQKLRCYNGFYYLNGSKVFRAYHLEVERGPVPLVFQTNQSSLTVEMYSDRHISAVLEGEGREVRGKCSK